MTDDCKTQCSKLFVIPQRWVIGIMGFWCFAIAYMLRVCLNIAITQMVVQRIHEEYNDPERCPDQGLMGNKTVIMRHEYSRYDWDQKLQGIILGSFYYGYVLTHIPGGLIAEKYGAKYTAGIGILITALCTLITPIVVDSYGAPALIAVRVIEGLGEGPAFPSVTALMSRWIPREERGIFGSLIFGGSQMGNILGMLISGFVMRSHGNWPGVFYVFGLLGVVWFIFWVIFVYSEPDKHPFISEAEKSFLNKNIEKQTTQPLPWRYFLTSVPLWAIIIAAIGHDWGYFTMVTDLPKYMTDVLRFSIARTGVLSALPYIVMWGTAFIFGSICDLCIKKDLVSIKNSRKIYTSIASVGPSVFILLASYVGCDVVMAVMMFTIAMGLMGAYYCGMKVNALDITPNYAGTATAFINGIAAISGIITPYIIGVIAPDKIKKQWQIVFWIVLIVMTATNIFYLIYAEGEEQWWNDIEKNGNPNDRKDGNVQHQRSNVLREERVMMSAV